MKWLRKNILIFLDVFKFLGIMALILMFINFNSKVATQTKTTQDIVKSQSQILDAIKQLATDNKVTSEQKANLIICMLQVPVNQRTTNALENCRAAAGEIPAQTATSSPPTPANATAPTPSQNTAEQTPTKPAPEQPKITKSITNFVAKTLRKVGL